MRGGQVGGVTIKSYLQKKNEAFSQRKIVLLFYSSNMAAAHILYKKDCQKKHRLVEITQAYQQSEEIYQVLRVFGLLWII